MLIINHPEKGQITLEKGDYFREKVSRYINPFEYQKMVSLHEKRLIRLEKNQYELEEQRTQDENERDFEIQFIAFWRECAAVNLDKQGCVI